MKKLVLGMAVATGLVVVMAGQSLAADLTSCDMNQAILEAEAVMREVGGEYSMLNDAKGVSIREHVKYLRERVEIARRLVNGDSSVRYPEELYATLTEGTRALELITGIAKKTTKQTDTTKPITQTQATTQKVVTKMVDQVQDNIQTTNAEKTENVTEAPKAKVVQKSLQTPQVKLAVAKIETGVLGGGAKLASLGMNAEVVAPEEMAGLEQEGEIEVPATGEVDTGELEKILMTIGVASAVGMLGLAGICAIIGRR